MINQMNLDEWLFQKEITFDVLVEEYGFEPYYRGKIILVDAGSHIIEFGGAQFLADFVFSDNRLTRINLMPIIEKVKEPNYPSEEYQNIKVNYCTELLSRMYGTPSVSEDLYHCRKTSCWGTEKYKFSCSKIMSGKDAYCGGNITIWVR